MIDLTITFYSRTAALVTEDKWKEIGIDHISDYTWHVSGDYLPHRMHHRTATFADPEIYVMAKLAT